MRGLNIKRLIIARCKKDKVVSKLNSIRIMTLKNAEVEI
jgi:hypothetical protein